MNKLIYLITGILLGLISTYIASKCNKEKFKLTKLNLVIALIFGILEVHYSSGGNYILYSILTFFLSILFITDLKTFIIPDFCVVIPLISWLIISILNKVSMINILLSLFIGFCYGLALIITANIVSKRMGKESLGGGDVKLISLLGVYFGLFQTLFLILISCLVALGFVAITKNKKGQEFPFGPSIVIAAILIIIFGSYLEKLYLSSF